MAVGATNPADGYIAIFNIILTICKLGFSYLNIIKNNKRERFESVEEELRVCLSHFCPDFTAVVKPHYNCI